MFWLVSAALAQEPLRLELSRRVPVSSSEGMAMGSAGLGFATGASGVFFHPAAPSVRKMENTSRFTGSGVFSFSTVVEQTGLGDSDFEYVERWSGAKLDFGATGLAYNGGVGMVFTTLNSEGDHGQVRFTEGHLVTSYASPNGAFGGGLRTVQAGIQADGEGARSYRGTGWQIGYLLMGLDDGWNLGVVYRSAIRAKALEETGPGPDLAVAPWELSVGATWVGRAPWIDRPARLAIDLVTEGPVVGASAQGVVLSEVVRQGRVTTFSPRMGLELEVIETRLRLRAGGWIEPSRLQDAATNLHGTGGFEVRLFPIRLWRWEWQLSFSAAVDHSRGYTNTNWISIGFWDSGDIGYRWEPGPRGEPPTPAM